MLADAYISSLGHLWSDLLISLCSVPTFGLLFSTTDSSFLTFTLRSQPLYTSRANEINSPLNFHKELSRITLYRLYYISLTTYTVIDMK